MKRNIGLIGLFLLGLCLGYACRSDPNRTVEAQGQPAPQFLITYGLGASVYYPDQKTLYVYGDEFGKCKEKLVLSTPGGPIAQSPCK